jgi:AAA domain-containing protein
VRQPITAVDRNIVFSSSLADPWALYRLATQSYPGLTVSRKLEFKDYLEAFAYRIEADFKLLRVARAWAVDDYVRRVLATLDPRHGRRELLERQLETHRARLAEREIARSEVYLAVRLGGRGRAPGGLFSGDGSPLARLREALGLRDPAALSGGQRERLRAAELRAFERVSAYLEAERASSDDVEWLVRRNYTRGLGEPRLDPHFRPQAITFTGEDGSESWEPRQVDLLRLHNSQLRVGARGLEVESELGAAHQALLVLGALPETTLFPGPEAELLYAPLEAAPFPVDAALSVEWIPNRDALALARKRKVDADNIYDEESQGAHGPSADAAERPAAARELEARLSDSERPPLLRAAITLAVGAASVEERERRVDQLRSAFGRIELHRPLGEQHRLFLAMLPGSGFPLPEYREHLVCEQFAAMVPTAANHAGSDVGPYIGYTLEGHQPIQFDLAEACQQSRPPTVLLAGTLGSGKTLCEELLIWTSFLQGSRVVDIDPKGDHHLDRLPGVAGRMEEIELSGSERWRGLLDPLRIAPAEMRFDLAVGFLAELLPRGNERALLAVQEAVKFALADARKSGPPATSTDVVRRLERMAGEGAELAARALAVHLDSGLAQLGFASPGRRPPAVGEADLVSLRIRNLPRPVPGTPRADYTQEERIGAAVLRLVAIYAMSLMGGDRRRHKVLGFDEAWFLMQDSAGRRLIEQLARWGRAENATTLLVTHLVSDAEEIDNLIGARFVFGFESEQEARKALALLGLDADDREAVRRLLGYRKGRCLFRDTEGRVVAMRIDPVDPALLDALDTTPRREAGGERELDAAA